MKFLEKDLEDVIFSADKEMLAQRGLEIEGKLLRQIRLGNYGVCDLLEIIKPSYLPHSKYHTPFIVTIYELKKEQISMSSFLQCIRYGKAIQSYFEKRGFEVNIYFNLIGKTIDLNSDLIYLVDFMDNLYFYTYEYEFDGIRFKNHNNYTLSNEGFSNSKLPF